MTFAAGEEAAGVEAGGLGAGEAAAEVAGAEAGAELAGAGAEVAGGAADVLGAAGAEVAGELHPKNVSEANMITNNRLPQSKSNRLFFIVSSFYCFLFDKWDDPSNNASPVVLYNQIPDLIKDFGPR